VTPPPAHVAPAPALPPACSALSPAQVGRALGRPVTALSAALLGEPAATRASHLVNCVYSYDRAPYPVALTITVSLPSGERPETFQVDTRGAGILTVHDKRFELTLWSPDFADQTKLTELARAALGGPEPNAPKEPARWPARTSERYACEIVGPADVGRIVGGALSASATAAGECQYAALAAPYRVVADVTVEPKPPGTAFALARIDELRAASDLDVRSVPKLAYGHFIRPARGPGAMLLFDAGTQLVTVTTPDSSERGRLERLAEAVAASLRTPSESRSSPSH
jgi:hypothetical protein